MTCPLKGDFAVCEIRDGYTFAIPKKKDPRSRGQFKVESRKTDAGTYLLLITKLKQMETKGVDYSALNKYFRAEFGAAEDANPLGMGYVISLLTYEPRQGAPKSYSDVFEALERAPSSLKWLEIWDVVDGIPTD